MVTKKKNTVIIIYGPIAVGKLSVGKELAKLTGFQLTHNHLIKDLVLSVFTQGTKDAHHITEQMRFSFYETAAKYGHNLIITHAFSNNFTSLTGLSDPDYIKRLTKRLERVGASVLFVHLQTDKKTLLQRLKGASRKEFRKLTNTKIMKEISRERDWTTSAPVKNNLVIDNTNIPPKKVAQMIVKHFKLTKSA